MESIWSRIDFSVIGLFYSICFRLILMVNVNGRWYWHDFYIILVTKVDSLFICLPFGSHSSTDLNVENQWNIFIFGLWDFVGSFLSIDKLCAALFFVFYWFTACELTRESSCRFACLPETIIYIHTIWKISHVLSHCPIMVKSICETWIILRAH